MAPIVWVDAAGHNHATVKLSLTNTLVPLASGELFGRGLQDRGIILAFPPSTRTAGDDQKEHAEGYINSSRFIPKQRNEQEDQGDNERKERNYSF